MYTLLIDGHSHGEFVLFRDALREAEFLIGETEIDPDSVNEISIVRKSK